MSDERRPSGRGGWRPGAGRKPKVRVPPTSMVLPPPIVLALAAGVEPDAAAQRQLWRCVGEMVKGLASSGAFGWAQAALAVELRASLVEQPPPQLFTDKAQ